MWPQAQQQSAGSAAKGGGILQQLTGTPGTSSLRRITGLWTGALHRFGIPVCELGLPQVVQAQSRPFKRFQRPCIRGRKYSQCTLVLSDITL